MNNDTEEKIKNYIFHSTPEEIEKVLPLRIMTKSGTMYRFEVNEDDDGYIHVAYLRNYDNRIYPGSCFIVEAPNDKKIRHRQIKLANLLIKNGYYDSFRLQNIG